MTDTRKLTDEDLEKVSGGATTFTRETLPDTAVLFNMPPEYKWAHDYVCDNIDHVFCATDGKNGGKHCEHCKNLDYYESQNSGLVHCCVNYTTHFRKLD
ncbi:MAG: hypothetical protein KBT35_07490 [Firmicutes bacterium]|nr:hypothetical protein [Candidatus Colivicinus equi]